MPVRKVTHIGKNIIGRFPSLKAKRMIAFESLIERDTLHLLEFDPTVLGFDEQPLTIEYRIGHKQHQYTPDFRVETVTGTVLVECKPQSQVADPRNQLKFEAATHWCAERGWTFEVLTDQAIRQGHHLANVKALFRHAHRIIPIETLHSAEQIVFKKPVPLRALALQIDPGHAAALEADLLCLVFHHKLALDTQTAPINGHTLVSSGGGV